MASMKSTVRCRLDPADDEWLTAFVARRKFKSKSEALRQCICVMREMERSHMRYEKKHQASASFRAHTAEVS